MIAAKVSLQERGQRSRWSSESNTADTAYALPHINPQDDPLPKVPIGGHPQGG
ncbi:hypothetical protein OH738_40280 (plasmid) [Streptomyces hirsutus]|uniref:hypothetical protein n=1 Tax=Streptomyces hirsutus TaxID=35620 RepID=UPI00386AF8DD|nr:hypothetical protein OH738_40280 [Streptomyces hirsutus]